MRKKRGSVRWQMLGIGFGPEIRLRTVVIVIQLLLIQQPSGRNVLFSALSSEIIGSRNILPNMQYPANMSRLLITHRYIGAINQLNPNTSSFI
jgi:hypothetical protein